MTPTKHIFLFKSPNQGPFRKYFCSYLPCLVFHYLLPRLGLSVIPTSLTRTSLWCLFLGFSALLLIFCSPFSLPKLWLFFFYCLIPILGLCCYFLHSAPPLSISVPFFLQFPFAYFVIALQHYISAKFTPFGQGQPRPLPGARNFYLSRMGNGRGARETAL